MRTQFYHPTRRQQVVSQNATQVEHIQAKNILIVTLECGHSLEADTSPLTTKSGAIRVPNVWVCPVCSAALEVI